MPAFGFRRPTISFIRVDFPAPLEPIRAIFSPLRISRSSPSNTVPGSPFTDAVGEGHVPERTRSVSPGSAGSVYWRRPGHDTARFRKSGSSPPPLWWAGACPSRQLASRFRRPIGCTGSPGAGRCCTASSSSTRWRASSVGSIQRTRPSFISSHMLAVIGDVLGVVLNDDDGLAVVLVQVPQHLVDSVGMAWDPAGRWARPGSGYPAAGTPRPPGPAGGSGRRTAARYNPPPVPPARTAAGRSLPRSR